MRVHMRASMHSYNVHPFQSAFCALFALRGPGDRATSAMVCKQTVVNDHAQHNVKDGENRRRSTYICLREQRCSFLS